MSQIRISQLPQASTVAGNTVLPVVQAGETQQATVDVLRAEIVGNLTIVDTTINSNDDLAIVINNSDTSTYTWNFGNTGNLTVPDAVIGTGNLTLYNINTADESQLSLSGSGVLLQSISDVEIQSSNSVAIGLDLADSAQPVWQFVADRDLPEIVTPAGGASIVNRTLMQTAADGNTWASYQVLQENSASLSVDNGTGITSLTIDPNGVAVTATGCSTPFLNVAGVTFTSDVVTAPTALVNLTPRAGARAFVNDGNLVAAGNFGVQIGGGGANTVPVWSDGTNWYIG